MMPDDEKALTIARRTRKNLDFIYTAKAQGEDVEEVTQLLNSMLGMLICLREEYFHGQSVTWDDVRRHNLEPVHISAQKRKDDTDRWEIFQPSFSQLITHLRHSFAHNCFSLVGDESQPRGKREIVGLEVWNTPTGKQYKTWEANLTIDELKDIAYLFIDYLEKTRGRELAA
jgi:hypothetical protein